MTQHHPSAIFMQPAVDDADKHFRKALDLGNRVRVHMLGINHRVDNIGHPDRMVRDVRDLEREAMEFTRLAEAYVDALAGWAQSLAGSKELAVFFTDVVEDAFEDPLKVAKEHEAARDA